MSLQLRIAAVVTLLFAVAALLPEKTSAQEIDFGKLDKFESFRAPCMLARHQKPL
jgi:hypothetical protein